MARTKSPPIRKDGTPRWLYEALRRINDRLGDNNNQLYAISRGESSFGGGTSLAGVTDHGSLTGLVPDDDHTQYFLLRGRTGGQVGFGSVAPSGNLFSDAGSFCQTKRSSSETVWSAAAISTSASVNDIIVLVLSTGGREDLGDNGDAAHLSITDTKGNTWTKQAEQSVNDLAARTGRVSIWTCVVTVALTAGVDTLSITFDANTTNKAIESRRFFGFSGAIVSLAGSAGGFALQTFPATPLNTLTINNLLLGRYLFVRGTGIIDNGLNYIATGGYSIDNPVHSNSTTSNATLSRNIGSRIEYSIASVTESTTAPTVDYANLPASCSIMAALRISSATTTGSLFLSSVNDNNASLIHLSNSTIYTNFDFLYFRNINSTTNNSYIRGSDGTFVGPVASTSDLLDMAADTNGDPVTRGAIIYGNSTPKWASLGVGSAWQFVGTSDGINTGFLTPDHGMLGGLTDDDHLQYFRLQGRSGGQIVGSTGSHGGANNADTAFSGRVIIDPAGQTFAYTANRALDIRMAAAAPTAGAVLIQNSFGSLLGPGAGQSITLNIAATGTFSTSAGGNQEIIGLQFVIAPSANTGVVFTPAVSGSVFQVSATANGGTVDKIVGATYKVFTTGAGTVTNGIVAIEANPRPGTATTTLTGLRLGESNSGSTSGTVPDYWGIDFGSAAVINYANVTNWTGIRIPAAPTNPTGTIRGLAIDNILSHHVGAFKFGSTSNPTHYVDIAAGTTTIAPIKLTSATPITTAVAGCIEFQTDDFFATISTGPARKAFILDDGTRLTSGRIPFATTNGRLVDDSDFTFSVDTLTITKIAATQFTGDIQFTGSGIGLPYGSCYGNEIGWTQASAAAGTFYEISDTDMSDGELNNVTHDGSGKLTVSITGRYLITYSISLEADAANIHLISAISINGTEISPGRMHFHRASASAAIPLAGTAIVNLTANDTVEVAVATNDAGTPTLSVEHLNISVAQVGG